MRKYSPQVQEMINQLTKELIKEYEVKELTPITKESLIEYVKGYLVALAERNSEYLKFEAYHKGDGKIKVYAANMYSLLSMSGIKVLPEQVEGLEEYETEFGTFTHRQRIEDGVIVYENSFRPIISYIHFEGIILA